MPANARRYNHDVDYERVSEFLVKTYRLSTGHINWVQPRWEYMHYHPLIRGIDRGLIGVWEDGGQIVGVAHPEHDLGSVYFQIGPGYDSLKEEVLLYAEEHLSVLREGGRQLAVFIAEGDRAFQQIASRHGYINQGTGECVSHYTIPQPYPAVPLPAGFRLTSLAEENDLQMVDQVLWRGFNHQGDPPADRLADRLFMQSAPNYRHDLNVVVVAPDGQFVSYCGMWYEPRHSLAYVEPVATDPGYRRLGLGRAAVMEGIRRCGELGAVLAEVGTDMPFYLSFGFRPVHYYSVWRRTWADGGARSSTHLLKPSPRG